MKELLNYFESFDNQSITFIIDNIDRLKYTARTLSQYKGEIDKAPIQNKYFPNTDRHHVYKQIYPSVNIQINICIASEVYEQAEHGFSVFNEYLTYYSNLNNEQKTST